MVHSPVTLPDIHSVFFPSFFSPPTPFLLFFLFFLLGKLFCSFSLTHLASFHNSFNRGMSHICRPAPRGWCDRNDQLRHYHTYGSSSSCPCVVLQHTSLSMGTYVCKLQTQAYMFWCPRSRTSSVHEHIVYQNISSCMQTHIHLQRHISAKQYSRCVIPANALWLWDKWGLEKLIFARIVIFIRSPGFMKL